MRAEVVPGCGAGVRREVCGVWLWCLWAARGLRGLVVVPVGGARPAGSGCGACGRRRGLAGPLPATRGRREVCGVWLWCLWAARGLRGLVVVPVGGGGAWPDHSQRREGGVRPAGPGRASRRRAERSSWRGRRAGGQASRRPEVWWRSCRAEARQAGTQRPEASKSKRAIEE